MTVRPAALVALLLIAIGCNAIAAPPKVVKASPDNKQLEVDPALAELRIVFDQPMSPGGRSLVNSSRGLFPELVGKPRWEDERTFVWPMKLEPNTDYWLSVNSTRFVNFRSKTGESAEPYPIAFRTRGTATRATSRPTTQATQATQAAVDRLKQAIDQEYAYRDLRKIDWEQRFAEFKPQFAATGGPAEFASVAAKLLSAAKDVHITMRAGERRLATYQRDVFPCVDLLTVQRVVPGFKKASDSVFTGRFENGTRYLCIASLPADDARFLAPIFEMIDEAEKAGKPLIIDLRPNGGGDEPAARKIAGCFIEKPALYAKHIMRSSGQFSEVRNRFVTPNPDAPQFRGRLVVLTGPATCSSCESFVLMLKQAPGCVTVGATTAGSSGNPRITDLGNGTSVSLPQWKALRPDGTCFEGEGIAPDVDVKTQPADFIKTDPIIAAALKQLGDDAKK